MINKDWINNIDENKGEKKMAFLQIGSTNPQFTFILKKNPDSGMLVRRLRKGHLFGYYSGDNKVFNCYFKDPDSEISYGFGKVGKGKGVSDSFEYVNPSRYNAPEFVLDAISEFLEHIIKKDSELDIEGYDNFLMINMINIKRKYLGIFQRYFDNITIEEEEICANNYRLWIRSKSTLKDLISFAQLFAFFNVLKNRYLGEDEISKYMNMLIKIRAPYFVKYIFKVNVLSNRKAFKKYKKDLEENAIDGIIEFKYGYLHDQRIDAVESLLDFKRSIVDFGCGEGDFAKRFYHRIADKDKRYYAIDIDEEKLNRVKRRIDCDNGDNLIIGSTFPDFGENRENRENGENVDVIMSEVIEHMKKEEAENIVKDILRKNNVKILVITTPNKDFNRFFLFDDEDTRCKDHKFEMGKDEFKEWMDNIMDDMNGKYELRFLDIGDSVNAIPATIGAIVREKLEIGNQIGIGNRN